MNKKDSAISDEIILSKHYRFLVENFPDIIYVLDAEGRFTFVNSVVEKVTGFSVDSLIGKKFITIVDNRDRQKAEGLLKRVEASVMDTELRLCHRQWKEWVRDYEVRHITISSCKTDDVKGGYLHNDYRYYAFGIIRDISDNKRMETQLRETHKMEAIMTLAGGVAHEFNNLFMVMQGLVSLMLLKTDSGHYTYSKLTKLEEYIQKGAGLTERLLNFAEEKVKKRKKQLNINSVLDVTIDTFINTGRSVSFDKRYDKEIWPVYADPKQMEHIFLNLFINALYAMPQGGTIKLVTRNVVLDRAEAISLNLSPGKFVKVSVSDSGFGMSKETVSRIFDPFFTTKEVGDGQGLGLSSVYGIMKKHRGTIEVFSREGMGTRFDLFFSVSNGDVAKDGKSGFALASRQTVLLAEYDEDIMECESEILEALGYHVVCASNANETIALYNDNSELIDVILLDTGLPDMYTDEILSRIREISMHAKVICMVNCTERNNCSDIDCIDFMQKPFNAKVLHQKLSDILEKDYTREMTI